MIRFCSSSNYMVNGSWLWSPSRSRIRHGEFNAIVERVIGLISPLGCASLLSTLFEQSLRHFATALAVYVKKRAYHWSVCSTSFKHLLHGHDVDISWIKRFGSLCFTQLLSWRKVFCRFPVQDDHLSLQRFQLNASLLLHDMNPRSPNIPLPQRKLWYLLRNNHLMKYERRLLVNFENSLNESWLLVIIRFMVSLPMYGLWMSMQYQL